MRLYTPLSSDEAARAERGEGFPSAELFFADRPIPDEADDDVVWVVIDLPDHEAEAFEQESPPELGYREFVIEGTVASRFAAYRSESRSQDSDQKDRRRYAQGALVRSYAPRGLGEISASDCRTAHVAIA